MNLWVVVSCIFFLCSSRPWGNDPIWRAYFSDGLKQTTSKEGFLWCFMPESSSRYVEMLGLKRPVSKTDFFSLKQPEGLGGCFLKTWYPQQPWVFLLEIIILGWFWGYHHLRKHPGSHHFFAIFSIFPRHQTTQNRRTGHSNSRERRGKTLLSRRSWRIKRSPQFQGVSRAMNWTAKLVCQDNRARTRISTARQCVGLVKAKIGCSEKEEQIHWVEFK